MKIIPNQKFLHDDQMFEQGQEYEVSEEDAEYFTAAGWVGDFGNGWDVSLDIQDMTLGHSAEVN